jgi:type II secretory pathway pseudopilin PulG
MVSRLRAFTLMELVVVIVIIMVLSAVTIPVIQARLDRGKWTEANTGAGVIRRAVKAYHASTGNVIKGTMDDPDNQKALEIDPRDLVGTYFVPADYHILSVTTDGFPVVQVTGSLSNAPSGAKVLEADGTWKDADSKFEKIKEPKKPKKEK